MNNEQSKDDYILQLKQKIIFLNSEIATYQNEIKQLKKEDYYALSLKLDEENIQLKTKKKQLSMELYILQKGFKKEVEALQKDIQAHEERKTKLINTIQRLVNEKKNLQIENTELVKKAVHTQHIAVNPSSPVFSSNTNVEQLLFDVCQKTDQQFQTLYEELKRIASKMNQHIAETAQYESNEIKKLLHTMKEIELPHSSPSNQAQPDTELVSHLDEQIHMISSKTTYFEKQLEQKMLLLDQVEQQLIQLLHDIEEK